MAQIESVKCQVCSSHLGPLLLAHVEEQRKVVLEVYVGFIHDKYGALPSNDIKNLVIPYTCRKHWTIYVVGEHGFFYPDSLVESSLHSDTGIQKKHVKLWATWSGHDEDAHMWIGVSSSRQWIQASLPQQNSD